jgi:broad specificity phosphatase PhoE
MRQSRLRLWRSRQSREVSRISECDYRRIFNFGDFCHFGNCSQGVILAILLLQGFMSNLFLVRHGQASFLEENYDKLSTKGEAQSRMLGEYWVTHGVTFDQVFSGPRSRQRHTALLAGEAYKKAGLPWPEATIVEGFDEFSAEAVIEKALPGLLESDPHVRSLHAEFEKAEGQAERFKTFQRMFEVIVGRWAGGQLSVPGIEPWSHFCDRVQTALAQITTASSANANIAVFTSGGPNGVAMQRALNQNTEATLRTAWMTVNSAYSHFIFSGDRFTLASYNSYPHITDREFFTYR